MTVQELDKQILQPQTRFLALQAIALPETETEANPDTLTFSVSSEMPVERWYGKEVLSHEPSAVNLERLPGMVLLWDHGEDPKYGRRPLGKVTDWKIEGKRGIATIKWADKDWVKEFRSDVEAGILTNVSFGYSIDEYKVITGDEETILATRWSPMEISLVAIPADFTVGVGRAYKSTIDNEILAPGGDMDENEKLPIEAVEEKQSPPTVPVIDMDAVRAELSEKIRAEESQRQLAIRGMGKKLGLEDLAEELVRGSLSIQDANAAFLEKIESRSPKPLAAPMDTNLSGFGQKESKEYSLLSGIRSICPGFAEYNQNCFEREVSNELAKKIGKNTAGLFVPVRNLTIDKMARRDTMTTVSNGTSNIIDTDYRPQDFIEALRNKAKVFELGARFMTGLQGPVEIPRQTGVSSTYWLTENAQIPETDVSFGQIGMNMKTVASRMSLSRNLLMQSSLSVENIVREDLVREIALAIDKAAIFGSGGAGNAEPRGVLNYAINTLPGNALGVDGGAPTYAALVSLVSEVLADNADVSTMKFLTNTRVKSKLMLTPVQASGVEGNFVLKDAGNSLLGYELHVSNQVPSNLTKGNGTGLSAIILGCWDQLIVGEWGVLEIMMNPYGQGYSTGAVELRAIKSLDMVLRHEESFAAITDAVTTI